MMLDGLIRFLADFGHEPHTAHARGGDSYVNPYRYDVDEYRHVDPALVGYRRTASFAIDLESAERLAFGHDGTVWIAGGQTLARYNADGTLINRHLAPGPICALAVHHATGVWLGLENKIFRYDAGANTFTLFAALEPKAYVTSIACTGTDVYAADAGLRTVHRIDMTGRVAGRIGDRDEHAGVPGFVIPSPYFDVRAAADGTVWAANTGRRSLEHYTSDGKLLGAWGMSSFRLVGFCGCCNPAHFTLLPDGGFITAEKGLVRVKRYTKDGKLVTVVAPPTDFDERTSYVDVACVDGERVLVLDPLAKAVHTYVRKKA